MQLPEPLPPPSGALEWLKWLAIVGPILFSAYVLFRSRTAEIWKGERDAALAKAERLATENKDLTAAKVTVERELAECRAKTDLGALMEQHRAFHVELLSGLTLVASNSDARSERLVTALEQTSRKMDELMRALLEGRR